MFVVDDYNKRHRRFTLGLFGVIILLVLLIAAMFTWLAKVFGDL